MSMSDPVADFLTRVRNAVMRRHPTVECDASKLKAEIAKIMKQEGFITDYRSFKDPRGLPRLEVQLKYDHLGESVIRGVKRVSSPGLRRHEGYRKLRAVHSGQGIAIVTTSKGIMTDFDCREQKIGGEVLCQVW
jgi:small subunit ribosomal protein S8